MRLYAFQRAKLGDSAPESAVAQSVGIARETVSRWKNVTGFSEWLDDALLSYRAPIHDLLEQVARDNLHDFRYWEAIADRFSFGSRTTPNESRLIIDFGDSAEAPNEVCDIR